MANKLYENIKNYIKENYKIMLVLLVLYLLFFVNLPYYISAPGGIINTSEKVDVNSNFKLSGSLNMAYVSSIKGNILLLGYAFINPNWDVEKEDDVVSSGETIKDEEYRNKLFLEEANDTALMVAFDNSNIDYDVNNNKVYVTYVDEKSKTDLEVGDQIIEIDNQKINQKQDLYDYVGERKINDKVSFKVIRNGKEKNCIAKLIDVSKEPKVGIIITEDVDIKSDYHVDIKFKGRESGSSGGLMMALTIYSYLNKIDLTHGKRIVGTGTIDKDGNVGEISGIKYKLIGAVKKGGDVFLVPHGKNYNEAKKLKNKYNYDIDIVPIKTFKEALNYLK
ncbi:MAG: PDZ domain-containing protein [Bacilli bacterium]|nr:PDZ domain-containing protein [Bacilli bacterium]